MDYPLALYAFVLVWYLSTYLITMLVEEHEAPQGGAVAEDAAAAPFRGEQQYVSFEYWNGGWNNRRFSLELMYTFAYVTGRTLVLPPKSTAAQVKGQTLYEDFYCLRAMRKYVNVLTHEEFQPLAAQLPKSQRAPQTPLDCKKQYQRPNQRNMCKASGAARTKAVQNDWKFNTVIFNIDGDEHTEDFKEYKRQREPVNWRVYDGEMWVHFPQNPFGLYYQMFYFKDKARREEVWRVVRDGLVLREAVTGPAQRIVDQIGTAFNAIHYRRGDFEGQFDDALVSEVDVVKHYKQQFPGDERPVYLSAYTKNHPDEKRRVDYIRSHLGVKVYVFDDFPDVVQDLPDAFSGVVEMSVCTHGKYFIGTKLSTFSSYITRLRGHSHDETVDKHIYYTDTEYEPGEVVPEARPYSWNPHAEGNARIMKAGDFRGARALWSREFPEAWELPREPAPHYRLR
eukprot:TRINITY_DN3421_c0_g1_i1.p1 TRINITY_DN3421_c0_g1~~TRINITY_DN3421_c0_g1_i1.p1  ORF type:complete len:453 (+),score=181.83 TRINITY_DN3421_c0_g1_i1:2062-3420(+)